MNVNDRSKLSLVIRVKKSFRIKLTPPGVYSIDIFPIKTLWNVI